MTASKLLIFFVAVNLPFPILPQIPNFRRLPTRLSFSTPCDYQLQNLYPRGGASRQQRRDQSLSLKKYPFASLGCRRTSQKPSKGFACYSGQSLDLVQYRVNKKQSRCLLSLRVNSCFFCSFPSQ
ncbi:unnamed protein product [Linum trigynum]|uniref:Uncharacterized protein n=1 Tax=Linum trigynum TaxID=586398 RepID=A0AAV2FST7_9ROSI